MSVEGDMIVRGVCPHDCPDTCAMLSYVRDGSVQSVVGDPDHPFTNGSLCAKVKNYENRVYSTDRILYPQRRVGPKGSGRFERISWQEALETIGTKFQDIISKHGAEAILPCSYLGQQGLVNGLHCGDPFFNALGATVAERTFCNSGAGLAHNMVLGPTSGVDPESFAHARHIVLWGCNIVATGPHHWRFIAEALRNGAKLTVIDPRRSKTARKADRHLQPLPGTDGALALGLINLLFGNDLVDDDFVAKAAVGVEELKSRASAFPLSRVAALTGLCETDIVEFANALGHEPQTAVRIGVALERQENGGDAVRSICALSVLSGSWQHVGGGIMQSAGRAFPMNRDALAQPQLIKPGTRVVNLYELGPALTGQLDLDPPVKVLFVYNMNPVSACGAQDQVIAGLNRDDLFLVVSEQFMTETADRADILLPATTQLEQFDLMYSWGHFYLTANQPAITPLGEAVSNSELFRRLARQMNLREPALQRDDHDLARDSLDWDAPALAGISFEQLLKSGYARLNMEAPDTRRPHAAGDFPTPSGKAEFVSSVASLGTMVMPHFRQGYEAKQQGDSVDPVPDYIELNAGEKHPFQLISAKSHHLLNSNYANLATEQVLSDASHVAMNDKDAENLAVREGDTVRIFNENSELRIGVRVTSDVRQSVVMLRHGLWRKLSPDGKTVSALSSHATARTGRSPPCSDVRVSIERVALHSCVCDGRQTSNRAP